jgi:predicted dehydrogenase
MKTSLIRVGLIGCGDYCSKTHAAYLAGQEGVSIQAISECIHPGELEYRQTQFSIPNATLHYEDMLETQELDAVVISTPHMQHYQQVKACLERGLHVIVDKPPACYSREIEELVQVAEREDRHLVVAAPRRFDKIYNRLRGEIQQEKAFGDLELVEIQYGRSKQAGFESTWRNLPHLSGGGVILDAGYHIIDCLLWITGHGICGSSGSLQSNGTNVETSAALSLELTENVQANLSIHLEMPRNTAQERMSFYGTRMIVRYEYDRLPSGIIGSRLVRSNGSSPLLENIPRDKFSDFGPAENLLQLIRRQTGIQSTGRDSISTIQAIETIYASASYNGRVNRELSLRI